MEAYQTHELVIKDMICSRCLKVAREDLESLGVEVLELRLGKLRFRYPKTTVSISEIKIALEKDGFQFVKDKNEMIAEKVKLVLIELVKDLPIIRTQKLSDFLMKKLNRDYWTLSKTFSKTEGITIQRYFILLRVEKAKELIEYNQLNFSEIAYDLGYQNTYNLSGQFKQVTGISMSEYKRLKNKLRTPLDKII